MAQDTKNDDLKKEIIDILNSLLDSYETDINSGVEDGTYEKKENTENLKWIDYCKDKIIKYTSSKPAVYVLVKGGLIQGASANQSIDFTVMDADNYDGDGITEEEQAQFKETHGTPNEWDEKITKLTEAKELKPVY